jgi:hypothetical protein
MKIRCYTLFDVTRTGVNPRREPKGLTQEEEAKWNRQRRQQINYETLLQVVNIRAQPEDITEPIKMTATIGREWGTKYKRSKSAAVWTFEFSIDKEEVFTVDGDRLAGLYLDCENVPMLTNLEETATLTAQLYTDVENRNIYFEAIEQTND